MRIGKLFGLTVPKLVLLRLDSNSLRKYCSLLNNQNDLDSLNDILTELKYLELFYDKCVSKVYASGEMNKLARQVKKSEDFYAKNEHFDTLPRGVISQEELQNAKKELEGQEEIISPILKTYDGEKVELSPLELSILNRLYRPGVWKRLGANIKPNVYVEKTVFGRKLVTIVNASGDSLRYTFISFLRKYKGNKTLERETIKRIKKDIEILNECLTDTQNSDKILKRVGLRRDATLEEIKERVFNYVSDLDFLTELCSRSVLENVSFSILETLYGCYTDAKQIDLDFYNMEFDTNVSREELEEAFIHLATLGLPGLDFYTVPQFFNTVESSYLNEEATLEISEPELVRAVKQIGSVINSFRGTGESL